VNEEALTHWGGGLLRQKQTTNKPTFTFAPNFVFVILNLFFSKRAPKIVKASAPTTPGPAPDVRIKKYVVNVWKGEATGYSEHGNVLGGFTEAGDFFTSSATMKFSIRSPIHGVSPSAPCNYLL
jgi:hypothetical protein